MAFYEEPRSKIEEYIGRRFPLAVIIIALISYMAMTGHDTVATAMGGAFMIIISSYFSDVSKEKETIKLAEEANKEI
jgi:hypothetical protein